MLQVNALFGRVGDEDEWGSSFVTAAGTKGLAPGEATGPLTVTSPVGYTGLDSRPALLGHSQFVDARVDLFAKYGSATMDSNRPLSHRPDAARPLTELASNLIRVRDQPLV